MANSQIHLPETVIDQLDPKLAKLCSEMPSELSLRIGELVRQALRVPIHPNRLVKYAFLFASAQLQVERDAYSREHATAARAELAGEFHGLGKESSDGAEAQRRYNRGRRARQQVASSLNSLQMKCQGVEKIAQKYHLDLPVHLQQQLIPQKIAAICKELLALKNAAALGDKFPIDQPRSPDLTLPGQTYVWWRLAMAKYQGKWNDMWQLAVAWRLTDARDPESFRTNVGRVCRGLESIHYPFGRAWQSVLSENP